MKKILLILCLMPTALFAEHKMECKSVTNGSRLIRCENDEAICYKTPSYNGGVYCKFKLTSNNKDVK